MRRTNERKKEWREWFKTIFIVIVTSYVVAHYNSGRVRECDGKADTYFSYKTEMLDGMSQ